MFHFFDSYNLKGMSLVSSACSENERVVFPSASYWEAYEVNLSHYR